jgi:transcriptional regulator with XRE-family HTH domain
MPAGDRRARQVRLVALGPDKPETDGVLLAFGERLKSLRTATGFSLGQLVARCFLRNDHISGLEHGGSASRLTVLLMLAHAIGVSAGEPTSGLAAPTRQAGRAQTLAVIARQPGIGTDALAQSLGLPAWYAAQIVRCLASVGEIASESTGWRHGWAVPREVTGRGGHGQTRA